MSTPIIAGTHLFGSKDGYRTLGSDGINSEEEEELSGLGFGQPHPGYYKQLLSHPTALGRRLQATGRYAVTRCLPGPKDDAGRATLRLASLVFEQKAWITGVRGGLSSLLTNNSFWNATNFTNSRKVELPYFGGQLRASRQDYLLVDHWVSIRSGALKDPSGVIVLPEEDNSVQAILHFAGALDPEDALYYRWGIRMLSNTFSGINIMTLDSLGNTTPSENLHQMKLEHPFSNKGVQNAWDNRQSIKKMGLPVLVALSAELEVGKTNTKEPVVPESQVISHRHRISRLVLYGIIILGLLLMLAILFKPASIDMKMWGRLLKETIVE